MVVVDPEIECDVKFNRFRPRRYNKYPLTRKWSNVVVVVVTGGKWKFAVEGWGDNDTKGGCCGFDKGLLIFTWWFGAKTSEVISL